MIQRRKNYLPTIILIIVLWLLLGLMIYEVEPILVKDIIVPGLYLPFWLIFFPATWLTLALIFGNTKRAFIATTGLTAMMILRIYNLGNILNLILVAGITIAIDRSQFN